MPPEYQPFSQVKCVWNVWKLNRPGCWCIPVEHVR